MLTRQGNRNTSKNLAADAVQALIEHDFVEKEELVFTKTVLMSGELAVATVTIFTVQGTSGTYFMSATVECIDKGMPKKASYFSTFKASLGSCASYGDMEARLSLYDDVDLSNKLLDCWGNMPYAPYRINDVSNMINALRSYLNGTARFSDHENVVEMSARAIIHTWLNTTITMKIERSFRITENYTDENGDIVNHVDADYKLTISWMDGRRQMELTYDMLDKDFSVRLVRETLRRTYEIVL